ncbi:hypothetical protein [Lentzea albida]|uniref:hypothetical protein n=1 Tax=Lentzea albida TaxID=65499 RepID=UPI000B7E1E2C|nr:hypothetical protein [Lentzea albida]
MPDIDFAAADRIVIAVPDDLDAFLITRAVRPLNPGTLIVALIREPENHALFAFEGAVTVHLRFSGQDPRT